MEKEKINEIIDLLRKAGEIADAEGESNLADALENIVEDLYCDLNEEFTLLTGSNKKEKFKQ